MDDEVTKAARWTWQGGSQTFLGVDIFSAYLGLVILGFVDEQRPTTFPAGRSLIRFVGARRDRVDSFLQRVEARTKLHSEVMQIARRRAPWMSESGLDEEQLRLDVSLMLGRLIGAEEAAENELARLVDALIGAIFCFGDRACDLATSAEDVLAALAALVGENSAPGRAAKVALSRWVMNRLPTLLDDTSLAAPDYRDWIRRQDLDSTRTAHDAIQ